MRILAPLFEAHGVDIVLSGHEHNYQRARPLKFVPAGPGQTNQVWPFFFYGTDPAQAGVYTYSGTNHGNGFFATPLQGPVGSPLPQVLKIRFTAPGAFKYICGIHGEDMSGEIDVVA